jgi:hypothetical protein
VRGALRRITEGIQTVTHGIQDDGSEPSTKGEDESRFIHFEKIQLRNGIYTGGQRSKEQNSRIEANSWFSPIIEAHPEATGPAAASASVSASNYY